MGKLYPPDPKDTALRWYCTAFNEFLTESLFEAVQEGVQSYMHAVAVNRVCGAGFRAF